MKKKLLVGISVSAVLVALLVSYSVIYSRNTTKAEAKATLNGFANSTFSKWYCENGYGKGIDNKTPWWEEIYVSNVQSDETAKNVEQHFKRNGYSVKNNFMDKSQDSSNKVKSFWEISGSRRNFSVVARVSNKQLTQNNCFKGFSSMNRNISPENYNSVIVIYFSSN